LKHGARLTKKGSDLFSAATIHRDEFGLRCVRREGKPGGWVQRKANVGIEGEEILEAGHSAKVISVMLEGSNLISTMAARVDVAVVGWIG
jgi:hypothetical protein